MKHRLRKAWWCLPLIGAAGLLALHAFRTPEGPRYAGRPLQFWLGRLTSDQYQLRLEAEAHLNQLGVEAIPELVRALEARDGVLNALRKRVGQTWFGGVESREPTAEQLAIAAARLLARFGPAASPASPGLVRLLSQGSPAAAREAEPALRGIGAPAVPDFVRLLAQGAPAARRRGLEFLRHNGDSLGADNRELVRQVSLRGTGPDPEERCLAIAALAALAAEPKSACPFLVGRLSDADGEVRLAAINALATLGSAAAPAMADLERIMAAGSPRERARAAAALWRISRNEALVLPTLTTLLAQGETRTLAATTLAEMGGAAAPAVPALLSALASEQTHRPSRTPSMVAVALGSAGPDAVPGLIGLAADEDSDLRINAAFALRSLGTNAAPAVPVLIRMLRASDPEERMTAANALGAIGPEAHDAQTELSRLATTMSGDVIVGHVASAARDALRRVDSLGLGSDRP